MSATLYKVPIAPQLRAEAEYTAWAIEAAEREFWNKPIREAIRAGRMIPLPWARADEANEPRPSLLEHCQLCGNQTRETKEGRRFCRACEAPQ
mgnify:CR=1 FL=1